MGRTVTVYSKTEMERLVKERVAKELKMFQEQIDHIHLMIIDLDKMCRRRLK